MKLNQNYANLQESYLFLTIAKKVAAYTEAHPDNHIIRMGIGDVTQPLVPAVIEAMHKATDEMAHKETFHGYSPDQGYDFLREAIQGYYAKRGVALKLSEIFVGDGAKSDVGNIVDIFADDNTVLIPDPVYPVYVDTNVMSGRKVIYLSLIHISHSMRSSTPSPARPTQHLSPRSTMWRSSSRSGRSINSSTQSATSARR